MDEVTLNIVVKGVKEEIALMIIHREITAKKILTVQSKNYYRNLERQIQKKVSDSMERLTTDKDVSEMGMFELAHNSCYIKVYKRWKGKIQRL